MKMSMEDIYPEGSQVCALCGKTNKAGEYFWFRPGLSIGKLCDACKRLEEKAAKAKQRALYVSGEEVPQYTDEITCPYCGHEESDSWEHGDEDDSFECGNCGRIFSYVRHTKVTYCTHRLE